MGLGGLGQGRRVGISLLLACPAVLLGGCVGTPPPVVYGHTTITNAPGALRDAASTISRRARAERVVLAGNASCWLVVSGGTLQNGVVCGPAHWPGDGPGVHWQGFNFRLRATGASTATLTLAPGQPDISFPGPAPLDNYSLLKPDGTTADLVWGGTGDAVNTSIDIHSPGMPGSKVPLTLGELVGVIVVVGLGGLLTLFLVRRSKRAPGEHDEEQPDSAWDAILAPAYEGPIRPPPQPPAADDDAGPSTGSEGPAERYPSTAGATANNGASSDWRLGHDPEQLTIDLRDRGGLPKEPVLSDGGLKRRALVIGPPGFDGFIEEPSRNIVTELAIYLGLHNQAPVPQVVLRSAVWPAGPSGDGKDVLPETVRQHISRLRRSLGSGAVPEADSVGGYQILDATSDWEEFQLLAARGDRSALHAAMELVRGEPFAGVEKGSYGWAWAELLVSNIVSGVVDAAHRLVMAALAAGDLAEAEWAAGRGLAASPTEETLLQDRMDVATAAGDASGLERAWKDALRILGPQAENGPLYADYRRCRARLESLQRAAGAE